MYTQVKSTLEHGGLFDGSSDFKYKYERAALAFERLITRPGARKLYQHAR